MKAMEFMKAMELSVIAFTQQLTSLAKPWLRNILKLILFYKPSKRDMQMLLEDFLSYLDKNEQKDMIHSLRDNKYARMEVLLRYPSMHKVIVPKEKKRPLSPHEGEEKDMSGEIKLRTVYQLRKTD